jgi:hypothetical protein
MSMDYMIFQSLTLKHSMFSRKATAPDVNGFLPPQQPPLLNMLKMRRVGLLEPFLAWVSTSTPTFWPGPELSATTFTPKWLAAAGPKRT